MHHFSTFKSSIRLYGLTRRNAHGQRYELSCTTTSSDVSAVRAFVSRLDAELAAQNSDFEVHPLSQVFCPAVFAEQQGGLNLHVCLGFAANGGQLSLRNEQLVPMGWFTFIDIRSWDDGYYLNWGDELPRLFGKVYNLLQLPEYNCFLDDLNVAPAEEMHWHTSEAIRAMPNSQAVENCCAQVALFDPVDCRWCFGSTVGSNQNPLN